MLPPELWFISEMAMFLGSANVTQYQMALLQKPCPYIGNLNRHKDHRKWDFLFSLGEFVVIALKHQCILRYSR